MLFTLLMAVAADPIIINVADVCRGRFTTSFYKASINSRHDDLGRNLGSVRPYRYADCLSRLGLTKCKIEPVSKYCAGFPIGIFFCGSFPVQCPRKRMRVYGIIKPRDVCD